MLLLRTKDFTNQALLKRSVKYHLRLSSQADNHSRDQLQRVRDLSFPSPLRVKNARIHMTQQ
jgi:hypothetical protein